MFRITPDVAADTGIHVGDGHLRIKRGGPHGCYQYDVTLNALEDQLYSVGTVMPTIASAYDLHRPGFHINPDRTWISVIYQSKDVALFKHEILGLPSGRKRNLSIPVALKESPELMRHFARELLSTDGVLGFYSASRNGPHKYARIQIKLVALDVIEELGDFLRNELGISFLRRTELVADEGCGTSALHTLQISRSEDIEIWRREIGFSNPAHISRMMTHEALGECVPRTSIIDRLAFLCGQSSRPVASEPINPEDLTSVVDDMRKRFGFPLIGGDTILHEISHISQKLESSLGRKLPPLTCIEGRRRDIRTRDRWFEPAPKAPLAKAS